MADSSTASSSSVAIIPVFKGEGYEHWSVLRSRDLWDVVYLGITAAGEGAQEIREIKKGCSSDEWGVAHSRDGETRKPTPLGGDRVRR
ncbi:hypothetical protein L1987_54701 [Smallanthus sonchifolius]|uniref:Uncharacterized protein n=1 Tax=Smallanthus sonchifolius TaxID=185202 RepID=A0ACB9E7R6_9ASTR|nr:hypothetical protein L1987_54701 [Smallanthus sonchifolius]